ncbi:MAG: hypothetical protein JXB26_07380 [Candidatus Aminicenantes bacterium]|nr:hypothetical protein [Candidatus Aminicenantes bacterium]
MQTDKSGSSDSKKKWLLGCGIGCGAVLIIIVILVVTGALYIKGLVQGFKEADVLMDRIIETYGDVEEYCPEPDGSISPKKLEVFLSVRETFKPAMMEIEQALEEMTRGRKTGDVEVKVPKKNVFKMIGLGFGLIPKLADFIKVRNQALLDEGMGMGEYFYLYVTVYYSWLGKDLDAGPNIQIHDEDVQWEDEGDDEFRRDMLIHRIHRLIFPMLRNQLEKLRAMERSTVDEEWLSSLEKEVNALQENRYRLPWQDGLPAVTKKSLEPFRRRLEDSYNPMTHSLELTFELER